MTEEPTGAELTDALAEIWNEMDGLCAELTPPEFALPTDCPGWSVQDNLVHIYAIESMLLGDPLPDHELAEDPPHVHNEAGRRNEIWVDSRRGRSGVEALEEFRTVTTRRIDQLRALDETGFDGESWTPMGPGTVRTLLPFRIFDSWAHAQDIRHALGRTGGFDSAAAEMSLQRCVSFMPYAVGKKVKPVDGTTVTFEITGPRARAISVGVDAGRGRLLDSTPGSPTVRLRLSSDAFTRLALGRGAVEAVVEHDRIGIEGDEELGRRVLAAMNTLF